MGPQKKKYSVKLNNVEKIEELLQENMAMIIKKKHIATVLIRYDPRIKIPSVFIILLFQCFWFTNVYKTGSFYVSLNCFYPDTPEYAYEYEYMQDYETGQ